MDEHRDNRLSETKEMFNAIGICGDGQSIGRLVGFEEDMLDYYYRIRFPNRAERQEVLWSAVGWFIPLRGAIPDRAYAFLEHIFNLNGCPPADEFVVTVADREQNIKMYGKEHVERHERRVDS
jgi:hypothetical protein